MRGRHPALIALFALRVVFTLGLCAAGFASAQTKARPASVVRILSAQAGLFGPPGTDATQFLPTTRVPLKDGQVFGWKMTVQTSLKSVLVLEEITLPQEPATWGDPEPDIKRKTSADGRSAITELWLAPKDGVIFRTWSVTPGDPKGIWVIKVSVQGQAEKVFRLEAH